MKIWKKIILIFYMAQKCLYIKEKNCIVHVFSSFEKKWKNYKGKLWRTSKMFSNSIQIWKTEKKIKWKKYYIEKEVSVF